MITLAIFVNGRPFCEADDLSTVTLSVEERHDDSCRITLHAAEGERAVQWLTAALAAGDEVVIRAVEATAAEGGPPPCGFCGRSANDVRSLVCGGSSAICDDCAGSLGAAVAQGTALPLGAVFGGAQARCGFCDRDSAAAGGIVARNGAGICGECLRACEDVTGHPRS